MEQINHNKYIFGAYLNTAFYNFEDACSAILVKLGNTKPNKPNKAYQVLSEKLKELETDQEAKMYSI